MAINENLLNPRRRSPLAVPLVVVALFALVGGAFLLGRASAPEAGREPATAAATAAPAAADADADDTDVDAAVAAIPPPSAHTAMGDPLPGTKGLRRLDVKVQGSLSATINGVIGAEVGDPLALVTSRLLVWWLDVARDLRPGDHLELIYELPENSEPVVHALRFRSGKQGRRFEAYRHQLPSSRFAHYYDEDGKEVEQRLESSPIDAYEQVTSLLKDGRRHKGVDFKAPVGTPVTMPWAGVVRRKNWNYRANGGSLEIEDTRGRRILFLHLSEIAKGIDAGTRVAKGQKVALSGNTGRSTAPHLHYQVMSSAGKVLDPFDLHETYRRAIPAGEKDGYLAAVRDLSAHFAGADLAADAP
ncbi:M23 family metallopeptidase [Vulgatibacter incomptus]|uniref:M23 peptidase domain protein n=1 Tax=Vulgatibacter incomptus TaxID=1391653 RepID=A0A0K1PD34_9BACT|nr:M23 family metallopeptidase [Vulgatibacter incomptus]AKU91412.1 M23 peptidase domain protein [Vulgatibacter incomptus]